MSRTVVVGLDGANWDLIRPWLDEGLLPNVEEVLKNGAHAKSFSYVPPVTVPNWKCYSTGKNPGKLGVYRFDRFDVDRKEFVFHHSNDFDSAELWDYLNDEGLSTAVVNMPTTYPPRPLDGVMICGGPDAREGEYRMLDAVYTYPEELQEKLQERYGYEIHPKPLISSNEQRGEEIEAILELIDLRFEVATDLLTEGGFDFLHVTSFYSNTLQHFFWRDEPVERAWRIIDRHVGRFLEMEDTNVVLMSDHGCSEVETVFYLNVWLQENGYLSLTSDLDDLLNRAGITKERLLRISNRLGVTDALARLVPDGLQSLVPWEEGIRGRRIFEKIDWEDTRAVANSQGLIYLLDERGTPGHEELKEQLRRELTGLTGPNGEELFEEIHGPEDLYSGPYLDLAPDLVIEFREGVHVSEAAGKEGVFHDTGRWRAENVTEGIFVAHGPDVSARGDLGDIRISDIAPSILRMTRCRVPNDMDGEPVGLNDYPKETREPIRLERASGTGGTGDEVKERLESLGYLS